MQRSLLTQKTTTQDFKDFYWLKEELVSFCKAQGIDYSGGKIELTSRVLQFLETGKIARKTRIAKNKITSNFNWNNEVLELHTAITDNYKNTEQIRVFFVAHIGKHFHFTTHFMNWAKQNSGKTLGDAIVEWNRLHVLKKDKTIKNHIAPQFEYNRYMRDFLADNQGKTSRDALKYWKLKRALPGNTQYTKLDLRLE